jgi:TAP-like protein
VNHSDFQQWESADATWQYFFETCIEAGHEKCPMAALNKTAEELESDMWAFFDSLLEVPISNGTTGMFLDSFIAKGAFFQASYSVANWPKHAALYTPLIWGTPAEGMAAWAKDQEATAIEARASDDAATKATEKTATREGKDHALVAAAMALLDPPNTLDPIDKFWAIHCSDRNVRVASYKDLAPAFERLDKISKLRGSSHAITAAVCAQWPIKAKESYEGDFAVETKHPVLLMGLTYDTPSSIAGAYNASASFANSKVIEVEGAGHTSYSLPSVCAGRHIIAYWSNGTVPEDNIKCETETNPWDEVRTWAGVFESLGQD